MDREENIPTIWGTATENMLQLQCLILVTPHVHQLLKEPFSFDLEKLFS